MLIRNGDPLVAAKSRSQEAKNSRIQEFENATRDLYPLIPGFWAGSNPVRQVAVQSRRKNKAAGTKSLEKFLARILSLLSCISFVAKVSVDAVNSLDRKDDSRMIAGDRTSEKRKKRFAKIGRLLSPFGTFGDTA